MGNRDAPSVHYVADQGMTGYGVAARRLMLGLNAIGCTVSWSPIRWRQDAPLLSADQPTEIDLGALRGRTIEPDVVIVHATPEIAERVEHLRPRGVPLVVHTVWEHEVLQAHWPQLLNRFDAVVVPTRWNAETFRANGVKVPVLVVPHAHDGGLDGSDDSWLDQFCAADTLLVHSVASWRHRKQPGTTIEAFARAFTAADDVMLALLTSPHIDPDVPAPAGPQSRRYQSSWSTMDVLRRHGSPPRVHLITDRISFTELAGLPLRSSAWLSLPHSEGWDLGCFDAAVAGCRW